MKGDGLSERLLEFGARMLRLAEALPKSFAGKHVGLQLLKSGTSAGANYEEGRGAESRADFVHKLGVAWKESREAHYWLRLIHRSQIVKASSINSLLQEANELAAILGASVRTAKRGGKVDGPSPTS